MGKVSLKAAKKAAVKRGSSPAKSLVKRPGENGFRYRPQYGLVVVCKDELHQRRVYARLQKLGLGPKVVCV